MLWPRRLKLEAQNRCRSSRLNNLIKIHFSVIKLLNLNSDFLTENWDSNSSKNFSPLLLFVRDWSYSCSKKCFHFEVDRRACSKSLAVLDNGPNVHMISKILWIVIVLSERRRESDSLSKKIFPYRVQTRIIYIHQDATGVPVLSAGVQVSLRADNEGN